MTRLLRALPRPLLLAGGAMVAPFLGLTLGRYFGLIASPTPTLP